MRTMWLLWAFPKLSSNFSMDEQVPNVKVISSSIQAHSACAALCIYFPLVAVIRQ
jgi:hypothetical protein